MEMIEFELISVLEILKHFGLIFVFLWLVLIAAIMLDLWDAISTAKKLNERIKSHRLRITVDKITEYWRFMLIAAIVDLVGSLFTFYIVPFVSILFCLGLVGVEIKSLFEHAKRRKSKTVEMKDIIQAIIRAANDKDAVAAYKNVCEFIEKGEKK